MERRMVFKNNSPLAVGQLEKAKAEAKSAIEKAESFLVVAITEKGTECASAVCKISGIFKIMESIDKWMRSVTEVTAKHMMGKD